MLNLETSRNDYTGNGAVDTYAYNFKIFADDDLVVKIRDLNDSEIPLTKTTHYTVSGVGETPGGAVALVPGFGWLTGGGDLITGYRLTIRRRLPLKQSTDIRNQGSVFPEDVENQFDKDVMIAQQQQDQLDRSIHLSETISPDDFDTELPSDIMSNPGKVLAVKDDGTRLVLVESGDSLSLLPQTSHSVLDGQAATDLVGETVNSAMHTSAVYEYEIIRGTTVFSTGRLKLHYRNSAWRVVTGMDDRDDTSAAHGVTFSVSGATIAQLRAACNAGAGNGTIKFKRHLFSV